ncbi:MAG: Ribonuclease G [Elusimicrobia bacterium ADurb.Bin231]|nr:MAG: Ribonuclease G [Elusimicrobia bacterium ADurb.Bin231]
MKEIFANCTEDERRVAIIEDGRLTDFFVERFAEENVVGNIYKGKVTSILNGLQAVFVNIGLSKNGYLPIDELVAAKADVTNGKHLIVQIDKAPLGTKGAKLTQNISLPGRYLVYMPGSEHIGVSKHITDKNERLRLKSILESLKEKGDGFIVRSEGAGKDKACFKKEIRYFRNLYMNIKKKFNKNQSISLLHRDLGLIFKTVRDHLTDDVNILMIDSPEEYHATLEFVDVILPKFKNKIRLYKGKTPIFDMYKIESQIENIRKQKIGLPSGGYLIIQEAESLCAIDVNSGKFTKAGSMDEIIFRTNMEAVKEVALQLRLRNIGGIIVIDIIDMKRQSDRNKVYRYFSEIVKSDKAKIEILPITKLGLIEMTRQRKFESIGNFLTEPCPYCCGSGNVLSRQTMALKIKKEVLKLVTRTGEHPVMITVNPEVCEQFDEKFRKNLETKIHRKIVITSDSGIHREDYRISIGS